MTLKKETLGNILLVKLDTETFALGRVIGGSFIEFYDTRLSSAVLVDAVGALQGAKVLFTLSVHKSWMKNSGWSVIGNHPENLPQAPQQFMQNIMNPNDIKIVDAMGVASPATRDEVIAKGIERLAVWEDGHIEERLRDYFAGKSNQWFEQLKVK